MAKYDTKKDPPASGLPDDESTGEQVKRIFKEHPGLSLDLKNFLNNK